MKNTASAENIEALRKATNLLISAINVVGQRATAEEIKGNTLLKLLLIDLLKKINASLNGFSILLIHFSEPKNQLLKIPLSLCLRGAISDCLTGIYLYTFTDDAKSLQNEVTLLSIDYAKYLRDYEEFIVQYIEKKDTKESGLIIDKWSSEFKKKHPSLFSSDESKWVFKKPKEIRAGSKYNPGNRVTDKDKFDWISSLDDNEKYIALYMLIRYFSQYQHYNFASRDLIDELPDEDFKKFVLGIISIKECLWAFSYALEVLNDDVKTLCYQINEELSIFIEDSSQ